MFETLKLWLFLEPYFSKKGHDGSPYIVSSNKTVHFIVVTFITLLLKQILHGQTRVIACCLFVCLDVFGIKLLLSVSCVLTLSMCAARNKDIPRKILSFVAVVPTGDLPGAMTEKTARQPPPLNGFKCVQFTST